MPDKVRLKIWDTNSQYWVECFCEGGWSVRNGANDDWIQMTQANTRVRSEDNTRWYPIWCPWDVPPAPPQTMCPCDDVVFEDAPCPTTKEPPSTGQPPTTVGPGTGGMPCGTDVTFSNILNQVINIDVGTGTGTVVVDYNVTLEYALLSVSFDGLETAKTSGYVTGSGSMTFYKGTTTNIVTIYVRTPPTPANTPPKLTSVVVKVTCLAGPPITLPPTVITTRNPFLLCDLKPGDEFRIV